VNGEDCLRLDVTMNSWNTDGSMKLIYYRLEARHKSYLSDPHQDTEAITILDPPYLSLQLVHCAKVCDVTGVRGRVSTAAVIEALG
jgi:hypothetical protein